MPRQDVPYGGAICRLRERIAEIFDKLGEKLHTINGVPGDGDGNVKIVSGSSAVVINNDPTQNEIAVSLDTSQLPAATVSSVNGQTGAVALDAGDIPSDGNSDVQSDIDALQTMDGALQGNINAEALARQNADSALQTNINAATASIPGAAAAAVAADNTIVRTSGNQNIADIKTVATQATGQYSQQIANSNKVRNEIYTYAVTTTGNQGPIAGLKKFDAVETPNSIQRQNNYSTELLKWAKMASIPTGTSRNYVFILHSNLGAWPSFGMVHIENDYGGIPRAYWIVRKYNSTSTSTLKNATDLALTAGTTPGYYDIWVLGGNTTVGIGTFIAINGLTRINDVVYPTTKVVTNDITTVGASNIYYAADYPYGL